MKFLYKEIKEERKKRHMTLKDVSKKSGVSPGLISSLERGIVNPSVDVLIKICGSLNIHPVNFIDPGDSKGELVVMRRKDQYCILNDKATSFIVSPIGLRRTKNAVILTYLNPKEEFGKKHISYDTSELIVVLNGKVKLYFGENENVLEAGDSVYFNADRVHYIKNLSRKKSVLVWCVFNK